LGLKNWFELFTARNIGMMENGIMKNPFKNQPPTFQYSNIPLFQFVTAPEWRVFA
jgi:hypothetical protein